eukprot:7376925-Prymnesium_polylepis.1
MPPPFPVCLCTCIAVDGELAARRRAAVACARRRGRHAILLDSQSRRAGWRVSGGGHGSVATVRVVVGGWVMAIDEGVRACGRGPCGPWGVGWARGCRAASTRLKVHQFEGADVQTVELLVNAVIFCPCPHVHGGQRSSKAGSV